MSSLSATEIIEPVEPRQGSNSFWRKKFLTIKFTGIGTSGKWNKLKYLTKKIKIEASIESSLYQVFKKTSKNFKASWEDNDEEDFPQRKKIM